MGEPLILTEKSGHVLIVTINRPDAMNAANGAVHNAMHEVIGGFQNDKDLWTAIITGAGDRAFCAGADLKELASGAKPVLPPTGFAGMTSRFDLEKPIIAAVNGLAMGGGFELALACDIIVAAENAKFALPEVRVGLVPLAGGLQRLPRAMGLAPAMALALTGRRLSAQEALEARIVAEVAPQGKAVEAAKSWAEEINSNGPLAVRAVKRAMLDCMDMSLPEAIVGQFGMPVIDAARKSADAREGPRAFAEKRSPRWRAE